MTLPLVIGNWKMNSLVSPACDMARSLAHKLVAVEGIEVVIAPPFTSLYPVGQIIKDSKLSLAGQNCYFENSGAFTGEISLEMLQDVGCGFILIGHSERRSVFGENDALINKKVHQTLKAGLTAVLCVGENLAQRKADETFKVLEMQLSQGLAGLPGLSQIVIAYEPVWAIGTGVNATPQQAVEVHAFIRHYIFEKLGFSEKIRIIYGGSVNPENSKNLLQEKEINGALVGGASLKLESFCAIINSALEP
ncbi:MAG: triose-phosphate isomerase [Nitrospinaceae bacterium]|nr:triose-phosphate isomerase [Nitrospinaceae bacterium]